MNLDDELKAALRREGPPADFAARVLARIEAPSPGLRWRRWIQPALLRWAMAAALIVVFVLGGFQYRRERERVAGERAKRQLVLALRITGAKLQLAQAKVYRLEKSSHRGQL